MNEAGFVRSDFFATMVLADAHLTAGELIRSGRCASYLREFRQHLARAAGTTLVTD